MESHEPEAQRRSEFEPTPAKTPHLHVKAVEVLLGEAIAITGNAVALLQLRAQIDRALRNETSHPYEEAVYREVNGTPFEVAVKRARSRDEMQEPVPRPERTAERLPWAESAGEDAAEKKRRAEGEDSQVLQPSRLSLVCGRRSLSRPSCSRPARSSPSLPLEGI